MTIKPGNTNNDVEHLLQAAVQVVALRSGAMGNLASAWTGSGTIIHPEGIILTNCHVVNPRAMGMSAPAIDRLAIAVAQRSDEPPALTYFVEIIVQAPQLDLALVRIVAGLNGRSIAQLNLPFIQLGDSDNLELGDALRIFGYPGIGGDTITFTSGRVSGFSDETGIQARRAWIKTDATIAGGNSGGTAVDSNGLLVGVPTQAAAGSGVNPVDARPVIDTNRDGRVDERDTPMAIGGFINGLRPINLLQTLLEKARIQLPASSSKTPTTLPPLEKSSAQTRSKENNIAEPRVSPKPAGHGRKEVVPATGVRPAFADLVFSSMVTKDGRPIHATSLLQVGIQTIYAGFEYSNMKDGIPWQQTWIVDGTILNSTTQKWAEGSDGRKTLALRNPTGFSAGEHHLALSINGRVVSEGKVTLGRRVDDTDSEISGQILDQANKRGIPGALVVAVKPGISVLTFVRQQNKAMIFTAAQTDGEGYFVFGQQLPKGQAYGLVILTKGYRSLAIEGALRISADAPEKARRNPIALARD